MTAEEYFCGVLSIVRSVKAATIALDAAREKASYPSAKSGDGRGGSSGPHDPMRAIDAIIDREHALDELKHSCEEETKRAGAVLYGADGSGGLAAALGERYADALYMRYIADVPVSGKDSIADVMHCSPSWVYELCRRAFKEIDRMGIAHMANYTEGEA